MNSTKIRRFTAYCLDLLIITLIATGLFQIKKLHPYADKYEKAYEEYENYVEQVSTPNEREDDTLIAYYDLNLKEEDVKKIQEDLENSKNIKKVKLVKSDDITEDEEDEVLLSLKDYFKDNETKGALVITLDDIKKKDDVIKTVQEIENIDDVREYDDGITSFEEMNKDELDKHLDKTGSLLRDVDFYGISYNVCWLLVVILYFTFFPYFNKGMTIGKRIVKLKMVRSDDENKKVALWQYFLKAILCPVYGTGALSNSLTFLVMIITPLFLDGSSFAYTTTYINLAICILCYAEAIMIAFRKDGLGISDKLLKVKVTDYVRN